MIDLRAARNDPDAYRSALARRGAGEAFDALLAVDERWRALVPQVDDLRAKQKLSGKPTPEQLEELRQVKEQLSSLEAELAATEAERDAALARVPNLPHETTADGMREEDAVVEREWGDRKGEGPEHLDFEGYDMERGAKISGSRFGLITGGAALLSLALYRMALDRLVAAGFTPVLPPVLVREEAMYATGFFPSEKGDYYAVPEDGLYLVGTSEVPLIAMHLGEILEELPLRYCAFSSCFRRESGAAGKDTRGMFRVHQFQKVEMVAYTHPDASWDEHERLLEVEESFVRELGLPYRVVNIAAGDLGAPAAKKYDIEAWFPSQQRYREITSCSNTTDFQARRSGVRYRVDDKRLETPHTLNGTAVTDRWALAILENFEGEIPEAVQRFGAPASIPRR